MSTLPTSIDTVWDVANALLEAANQQFEDNDLVAPSHQFVSWQYPAWDCCDHLIVHFKRIMPTRASQKEQRKAAAPTILEAELVVTLIGCAAVGDPIPTDDAINENAHVMYQEAWTLYQGLICDDWTVQGLSEAGFGNGCKIVRVGPLVPHVPMGGCESAEITFTLEFS